jgi:hypothetical protein
MVKPDKIGLAEHVTFSVTVEGGELLLFMIPKPAAKRLEALALRRGVRAEQIVAEWIRIHIEQPTRSDDEMKSYRPKDISGCSHGFPPLRRGAKRLDELLAFALSMGLLLADIFDYWQ